jgi:crotonobetainyl-CoA:carnitine CoA-transferase CaiB-like acyl-CoA transferase
MIEVPMFETMAQFVLSDHAGGGAFVPPEGEMGYRRLLARTRRPYATQDGYILVMVYTDRHWRDFSALAGCPGLLDEDARFASQEERTRHAEAVGGMLEAQLRRRTTHDWLDALQAIDIPCCKVNALEDLFEDPHLQAVGFFQEVEHPTEGKLKVSRFPVQFSRSPAEIRALAPNLGEHNAMFDDTARRQPADEG